MPSPPPAQDQDSAKGLMLAVTVYTFWGFLPLYMKLMGAVLIVMRRTSDLREALRNPAMLGMACVCAALVSINWGFYVYAVFIDRALEAAIGYYINPLFSVFMAAVVLGERLSRVQLVAIALAAAAVVVLTLDAGGVPWLAMGMTLSWGFYALAKKSLPIGPNQGFLLEVLILLVPALGYVGVLAAQGGGQFGGPDTALLLGCGLVTAIPLLIYANSAKLLRLSTIGILQYIAPTLIFLIAVFVFDEPFGRAQMIAFPLIWAALALYSWSILRSMRRG